MAYADQVIAAESGGNPTATNPYSSAAGLGGFTNRTWIDTIRAHHPDLAARLSPQELLALRGDETIARQMIDALASDNANVLRSKGLPVNQGTLYLAHFAGPTGAAGLLSADDSAPVSSVMSPEAMRANPFLSKMTVGDLKSWAARKGGGSIPASPQAPAPTQESQPEVDATTAALQSSQGGGAALAQGAGGAPQPVGGQGADGVSQIPAMLAASEPQMPAPTELKIDFQTPPGIARARMMIRAMMQNPIGRTPTA